MTYKVILLALIHFYCLFLVPKNIQKPVSLLTKPIKLESFSNQMSSQAFIYNDHMS